MENSILGVIVEGLVAVLLLATISYCIIVNRKLESLRQDKQGLKEIIHQLSQTTMQAESAISNLQKTVKHSEQDLALRIDEARTASERLTKKIFNGQLLLKKASNQTDARPVQNSAEEASLPPAERAELWAQLSLKKLAEDSRAEINSASNNGSA